MNKYWLTLFPDTFLWTKRDKILIYNSKKNQHLILDSSNEYKRLCNDLVDLDNLYSVEIKESQLKHKSIIDFIKKIEAVEAGILVEVSEHTPKPISYYPHLKLQRDLGLIKWEHERGIGGNIASNLHELTFYLNGSKNGNDTFFKQIIHPVNSVCDLYYSGVMKFISNCNGGMLYQVNLVGNLLDYPNLDELIEWLLLKKLKIKLFLLIDDFRLDSKRLEKFASKVSINLIVTDVSKIEELTYILSNMLAKIVLNFTVTSETNYNQIVGFIQKNKIEHYAIYPLYTGGNLNFFEDFIYLDKDDFNKLDLSKKDVFVNMAMNLHNFGKLTIMPDGKIFANVNDAPLGSINNSVYDIIYKEMAEGSSWLKIRDMKPCNECIYQWLCPSPSNYEFVLGKPNLCNLLP